MAHAAGSRRRTNTEHIRIEVRSCAACGDCVAACPRAVLRLVAFFRHRHVRIARSDQCVGCLKCVATCVEGAITAVE